MLGNVWSDFFQLYMYCHVATLMPAINMLMRPWCLWQIESAVQLLRGHILEALENRSLAVECYREALQLDVQCYEALDCLIQHHMLTALEGFSNIFIIMLQCLLLDLECKVLHCSDHVNELSSVNRLWAV
jgi:hypothetical protein